LVQPSRNTNNINLNGIEIVVGGTIIMPSATSNVVMMMSIAMNGKYNKKPISKAFVSSDRRNEGTKTVIESLLVVAARPSPQIWVVELLKNSSCFGSVCLIRKGHIK